MKLTNEGSFWNNLCQFETKKFPGKQSKKFVAKLDLSIKKEKEIINIFLNQ